MFMFFILSAQFLLSACLRVPLPHSQLDTLVWWDFFTGVIFLPWKALFHRQASCEMKTESEDQVIEDHSSDRIFFPERREFERVIWGLFNTRAPFNHLFCSAFFPRLSSTVVVRDPMWETTQRKGFGP